ncbi:MAG TPA: benzoylformate decarboxylase [Acidimicrobiales bacterium]|nr:benzoylformate decarboxylase [Acidimicrobiales bacterium]
MTTVRDAAFEVFRRYELTTIFANPGSTEIALLTDLPEDLRFVLALHEGSVVGAATGFAIASGRPALAVLHTTAGLGNATGALATARTNRAPLVVIVGQQDRRHLAFAPFLAGELEGLAGSYPVWSAAPVRAQDVPGAIARAWHEACEHRGPAIVVVPMDDWRAAADDLAMAAPGEVQRPVTSDAAGLGELAELVDTAISPAIVAGAGADSAEAWSALTSLAERLACPVWQEPLGARAGFPQDHQQFAGHLPSGRFGVRDVLAPHDVVLVVGAPAFRHYPYEPGPLVLAGTKLAMVTDDASDALHSPVDLALIAPIAATCRLLAEMVGPRAGAMVVSAARPVPTPPEGRGHRLRAAHVLSELARRIPPDTVLLEEAPSNRPTLHRVIQVRRPLGFLSAAMGGLGFAMPAAVGVRLASPRRPVVAVVGDGSSLYAIQSLWTAAHYGVGVLFVVLSNGRYSVLDQLAKSEGRGVVPWPPFEEIDVAEIALGFGCESVTVEDREGLVAALDKSIPGLREMNRPFVLNVAVAADLEFVP